MTPEARDARLHATELHEYLKYYLQNPPLDRPRQMALVPEEYRKEVWDRLNQFDILPPPLQKEALAQSSTADYFMGPVTPPVHPPPPMPPLPGPADPIKALSEVPEAERSQVFATVEHFFDLDDDEQQAVIRAIPLEQRGHVAKTLYQLKFLPKEERAKSLDAIQTLAAMTDEQRRVFFSSVERWKTLTDSEKATWLRVVSHLPPAPSLPIMPPNRKLTSASVSVATNPGNP
jgi:hypothetical protein